MQVKPYPAAPFYSLEVISNVESATSNVMRGSQAVSAAKELGVNVMAIDRTALIPLRRRLLGLR